MFHLSASGNGLVPIFHAYGHPTELAANAAAGTIFGAYALAGKELINETCSKC
jgi:hypothetical protein